MQELDVPLDLHPSNSRSSQHLIHAGWEELLGAVWALGAESAGQALRMIREGVFDRFRG